MNYYFDGLCDALNKRYRIPESGNYVVTLTNMSFLDPPFTSADGGDFNSGTAGFIASSDVPGAGLWELGTPASKFDGYSTQSWLKLML